MEKAPPKQKTNKQSKLIVNRTALISQSPNREIASIKVRAESEQKATWAWANPLNKEDVQSKSEEQKLYAAFSLLQLAEVVRAMFSGIIKERERKTLLLSL